MRTLTAMAYETLEMCLQSSTAPTASVICHCTCEGVDPCSLPGRSSGTSRVRGKPMSARNKLVEQPSTTTFLLDACRVIGVRGEC